jgi:hypothetical protein
VQGDKKMHLKQTVVRDTVLLLRERVAGLHRQSNKPFVIFADMTIFGSHFNAATTAFHY